MREHTPGPWRLDSYGVITGGSNYHTSVAVVASCNNSCKLPTRTYPAPGTTQHANARLIAAAPELLEACKTLLTALGEGQIDKQSKPFGENITYVRILRDVVRKSEPKR